MSASAEQRHRAQRELSERKARAIEIATQKIINLYKVQFAQFEREAFWELTNKAQGRRARSA